MATQKPSKPNVTLPDNFGGIKTPYSDAQIRDGYQDGVPEIVDGGNINFEKDAVFQKLKYLETIADAINSIPTGKFLVVNSNNQFDYEDSSVKSSFGNIGDIKYTSRTDVPEGGAWCDGALYTKAQFPDVYQMLIDGKIQSTTVTDFDSKVSASGSCGFFGLDTSNEHFKVPLLKDVYLKAGQTQSMFGAESLPNITGELFWGPQTGITSDIDIPQGAFYGKTSKSNFPFTKLGQAYTGGFDASRSSSAYQDGAKVNPDHVTYRAYVVLYASAAEASVAQAQEFMMALGGKANVDMDNVSTAGKQTVVGWGMPDYSAGVQICNLNTGQITYTAEFDCLFQIRFTSAGYCHWKVNDGNAPDQLCGSSGSSYTQVPIYLLKGTKMTGIGSSGSWDVYVYPLRGVI